MAKVGVSGLQGFARGKASRHILDVYFKVLATINEMLLKATNLQQQTKSDPGSTMHSVPDLDRVLFCDSEFMNRSSDKDSELP